MDLPLQTRRFRRLKTLVAILIAILSIPFLIVAMMGAAGDRR